MPARTEILRYQCGAAPTKLVDELAEEEPLEIRVRNRAISVTMRTPGHDEELAAGFLLTEGIISTRADLSRIEPCAHDRGGNVVNAILSPQTPIDFERLTRHVFASSSCGLCGKATIEAVHQRLDPVSSDMKIDAALLLRMPEQLRGAQVCFDQTGGLHAAGLFDSKGNLLIAREDVGRHNAVDKVLGHAFLHDLLPLNDHVLLVSGRASFEILQKSLAGGVPIVAAVSAPSSLAVEFARESNQTLLGFLRAPRMNVYAGVERITWDVKPGMKRSRNVKRET